MNQVFTVAEFLKDSLNTHGLMGDMFISIFLIYYILITHGSIGANNYVKKNNIDFLQLADSHTSGDALRGGPSMWRIHIQGRSSVFKFNCENLLEFLWCPGFLSVKVKVLHFYPLFA